LTDTTVKLDGSASAGFHFPNVTIIQGATITAASLTFESLSNYSGLGPGIDNTTLYGDGVDNSAVFSTANNNISGRALTSNSVANPGPDGAGFSANITAIVQEIVNRGGWASGNAMSMLFIGNGTAGTHYIIPYLWDYFLGTYHASLNITVPGGTLTVSSIETAITSETINPNLVLLTQVRPGIQSTNGPQVV
jgi:hypothetical protein